MSTCGHVYRGRPQPQFAARRAFARNLSRGRQDQKAHPSQPDQLARGAGRGFAHHPQRRNGASARRTALHHYAVVTPRHVAAVLAAIRATGLDRILGPEDNRPCKLVLAMIMSRIIAPASKLATARMLDEPTACASTAKVLGLGRIAAAELYEALDWLFARQPRWRNSWPGKPRRRILEPTTCRRAIGGALLRT